MNERRRWTVPKYTIQVPSNDPWDLTRRGSQCDSGWDWLCQWGFGPNVSWRGWRLLGPKFKAWRLWTRGIRLNTWLDLLPHLSCLTRPEPAPAWRRRRRLMSSKLLLLTKKPWMRSSHLRFLLLSYTANSKLLTGAPFNLIYITQPLPGTIRKIVQTFLEHSTWDQNVILPAAKLYLASSLPRYNTRCWSKLELWMPCSSPSPLLIDNVLLARPVRGIFFFHLPGKKKALNGYQC